MQNVVDFPTAKQLHGMETLVATFQHSTDSHPIYQIYQLLTQDLVDGCDSRDSFYRQYLHGIVKDNRPLTVFEKQFAVSLHLLLFAQTVHKQELLVGNR